MRWRNKALALGAIWALGLGAGAAQAVQVTGGAVVTINEPGVYGQIRIGNIPPLALVAPQPVIIAQVVKPPPPMYLYVPPGHQKHWGKHCHRYHACGHPVYFVREEWVRERYEAEHPGRGKGHGKHPHGGPPGHARGG